MIIRRDKKITTLINLISLSLKEKISKLPSFGSSAIIYFALPNKINVERKVATDVI